MSTNENNVLSNIKFTKIISVDCKILRHLYEVKEKTECRVYSVGKISRYQHETMEKMSITVVLSPFALSPVTESVLITILIKLGVLKLKTGRNIGNKIPTSKQLPVISN